MWYNAWTDFIERHYDPTRDDNDIKLEYISHSGLLPLELLERHPDWPWDWEYVSYFAPITFDFLKKHRDYPWDISSLCYNESVTPKIVEDIILKNNVLDFVKGWTIGSQNIWIGLSRNVNIPLDFIEKHPYWPWEWQLIVRRKDITPEFIKKYNLEKYIPWGCWSIYEYKFLTTEFIEEHIHEMDTTFFNIAKCSIITFELVKNNLEQKWDWHSLSVNLSLTIKDLENNLNLPWNWYQLSKNKSITPDFIKKHPYWPWRIDSLSTNPSMTLDFIEETLDPDGELYIPWNWGEFDISSNYGLSSNTIITVEFIKKYINKSWNFTDNRALPSNPNLTPEFIENFLINNDIAMETLSYNQAVPLWFIEKHDDKAWSWWRILSIRNDMTVDFFEKYFRYLNRFPDIVFSNLAAQYKLTDEFKQELYIKVNEFHYRPNKPGFFEALNEYESLASTYDAY